MSAGWLLPTATAAAAVPWLRCRRFGVAERCYPADRGTLSCRQGRGRPRGQDASAFGQDSLRTEPEESDDEQPDGYPLQCRNQAGGTEGGDVPGCLLERERYEDRAQDRATMVARAADDDSGEQHDGLRIAPPRRRPEVDEPDQNGTGESRDRATEDQHVGAQAEQVLAQRVGDHVVVTRRPKRSTVRRLRQSAQEPVRHGGEREGNRRVAPLVASRLRVEALLQWRRDQRQARITVEERAVVRHQQVGHHRGDEEADRGEVAAEPAADEEGERQGEQAADDSAADPRQREGQVPTTQVGLEAAVGLVSRQRQHAGGVRAGGLEDDVAEVGHAGHAELLAESEAGQRVDTAVHEQRCQVVQGTISRHGCAFSQARAPSRPVGRTASITSSRTNATTSL